MFQQVQSYQIALKNRKGDKMEDKNSVATRQNGRRTKKSRLAEALNVLSETFGIEFGSITIKFHNGKWSPRIEIEKRVIEDVKE